MSKIKWRTPLHQIYPQCEKALSSNNGTDTTNHPEVLVPKDGLYGIILGHDENGSGRHEEERKEINHNECYYESMINLGNNGVEKREKKEKTREPTKCDLQNTKLKMSKLDKVIPLHCGCTFRATFKTKDTCINTSSGTGAGTGTGTGTDKSSSILLPITSHVIDPTKCNIESCSSSFNQIKVVTSERLARLVYLPENTKVSVEYVTQCSKRNNNNNNNRTGSSNESGHNLDCSWQWGLILHRYSDKFKAKELKNNNHAKTKTSDINTILPINKNNHNDHQDDSSPVGKKPRHDDRNHVTHENVKEQEELNEVDFFPLEARKKPLMCTICCKKFPLAIAIQKHCLIVHNNDIAKAGTETYHELMGPPILRKPLSVAYEDNELVIVVKPQGLSVQGEKWTLAKSDLLMPFKLSKNKNKNDDADAYKKDDILSKPRPVHRLDAPTGGILVVAKKRSSEISLRKCFAERSCRKRYRAIVFGRLEANKRFLGHDDGKTLSEVHDIVTSDSDASRNAIGEIDSPISGKKSISKYSIVSYTPCLHPRANGWITTVDLFPVTGRNHQLRKHMKLVGHPIWGDRRYGQYEKSDTLDILGESELSELSETNVNVIQNPHSKLCLWALEITFPHPIDGNDRNVNIDEPEWYQELRHDQERKWQLKQEL